MGSLQSFLNELKMISTRKQSSYVYRDELDKKKKRGPTTPPEAKPLLRNRGGSPEEDEAAGTGGRGFKVKVLMTKAEAARLLSKCKDGRRLELKDLADELTSIPAGRVIHGDRPRLPTVAEET